jgi:hypothetical protein
MFRVTTLPDDKISKHTEDFFGKRTIGVEKFII